MTHLKPLKAWQFGIALRNVMPKPCLAHKPQPVKAGGEGFRGVYETGQAPLPCSHAGLTLGPGCAGGCNHTDRFDLPPARTLFWFT